MITDFSNVSGYINIACAIETLPKKKRKEKKIIMTIIIIIMIIIIIYLLMSGLVSFVHKP